MLLRSKLLYKIIFKLDSRFFDDRVGSRWNCEWQVWWVSSGTVDNVYDFDDRQVWWLKEKILVWMMFLSSLIFFSWLRLKWEWQVEQFPVRVFYDVLCVFYAVFRCQFCNREFVLDVQTMANLSCSVNFNTYRWRCWSWHSFDLLLNLYALWIWV